MSTNQTTQEIILTKGLPASGKSTWAKKMIRQSNNFKRINKDDLRMMIDDSVWSENHEKFILNIRDYIVGEALRKDKNIIIDDTNFEDKHFDRMCEIAQNQNRNISVREMYFPVDINVALERNSKREGTARVPDEIIYRMFNKYIDGRNVKERAETFTKYDGPPVVKKFTNLPKAIICDLDGTLAIINDRSPFDASRCERDILNKPIADLVMDKYKVGFKIIFVSGRDDQFESQTRRFIDNHLIIEKRECPMFYVGDSLMEGEEKITFESISYDLHMRKTGDSRKDFIVKREIYDELIKDKYDVEFVIDDRPSVVRMWRSLGLLVLQLNHQEF